jgi:hypothetical protein
MYDFMKENFYNFWDGGMTLRYSRGEGFMWMRFGRSIFDLWTNPKSNKRITNIVKTS